MALFGLPRGEVNVLLADGSKQSIAFEDELSREDAANLVKEWSAAGWDIEGIELIVDNKRKVYFTKAQLL